MNKKIIIVSGICILVVLLGLWIYSITHQEKVENTNIQSTNIQSQSTTVEEEKYYSDGYYYHRTQDCPNRKRNMGSSTFTKRGCELYGDKPCPKCFPN